MKSLRRDPLYKGVAKQIQQYIIDADLKVGDKIMTEKELEEKLNVSRTAIREGLKALEMMGIVEIRQGRGTSVGNFARLAGEEELEYKLILHRGNMLELVQIREILEQRCVSIAIKKMKTEDMKRLQQIIFLMEEKASRGEDIIEEDILFHRTLAEIADKPIFLKLLEIFWDARMAIRKKVGRHQDQTLKFRVAEHKLIFEAIKESNLPKVKKYLKVHLHRMQKSL